ncbi:DUF5008 domain-containing protein [Sphingobacterium multivorum]|uniref:DUF5008 domain-containing protein n=1 Tax=Sphingobacterium multivorum TaxID=28454 RepID=UPI002FD9EB98
MRKRIKFKTYIVAALALASVFMMGACHKSKGLAEDPYAGGKSVLDINFISKSSELDEVYGGAQMELIVRGLMKYKDNFKFYVNEIESEVVNFTDSTIRFTVPNQASTGSVWIVAEDQTFFGPVIKIAGRVAVDESFKVVNGAARLNASGAATVYDMEQLPNGKFWLVGSFNVYEQNGTTEKPKGGITQINAEGAYNTDDGVNFGIGATGGMETIYSINRISSGSQSGKYIVAGNFSGYNTKRTNRQYLNNITRLDSKGFLDTVRTTAIVNPKPAETWKNADTIPAFNGGVDGIVRKTFIFGEQIYVIGNFQNYKRIYYPNSSYDEKVFDVTRMLQLVRVNMDGSMDSTFHYNEAAHQSPRAANGTISDAIMQNDGKLILVGSFTSFNNITANHIVRLNLDGSVDDTFMSGSGADGDVSSIRYNTTTGKIVLSGTFTSFDGHARVGVVLLNQNGSVDESFVTEKLSGGGASFAGQLNSGKIIVAGTFNYYGAVLRQGFAILNPDGTLAAGYNNTGGFQGRIYDMRETVSGTKSTVTFVGDISRFNSTLPKNVLRIIISN